MSRPLRIQYPDAWYHLMNRGRRREKVYINKDDYVSFIELLRDASEVFNLRIAGYCLIPNHYHLLIQTPDGNLSRCMRHINGVYTQRFNRRHGHDGPLFRGRYRSILIDQDSYLLELIRYIHRNPFEAGFEKAFGQYPWSSHKGYLSNENKWDWLHKEFILSMFSEDRVARIELYREFVLKESPEDVTRILGRIRVPPVLGDDRFLEWVKESFYNQKSHKEVPQSKSLAPSVEEIRSAVCKFYSIDESSLSASKRGVANEPRNIAIYLARRLSRKNLDEIARAFNVGTYSSVSSVVNRTGSQLRTNSKLKKSYQKIYSCLTMSQAKT